MSGRVVFIGAGPGDPELITVKGLRFLQAADLVLYAGSLVPRDLAALAGEKAELHDSSSMTLEETHALMRDAARQGKLVARLHTGDPLLYGAAREQMVLLEADGIDCEVVPGVSALFAAAAAAKVNLTVPGAVQSLAVTRLEGKTPVPEGQGVADYAAHGGSLAVYLSGGMHDLLARELRRAGVSGDCTIVMAQRVGWPDEKIVRSSLDNLEKDAEKAAFSRQTLFLVLPGEGADPKAASRLYDKNFSHAFRQLKDRPQDDHGDNG